MFLHVFPIYNSIFFSDKDIKIFTMLSQFYSHLFGSQTASNFSIHAGNKWTNWSAYLFRGKACAPAFYWQRRN